MPATPLWAFTHRGCLERKGRVDSGHGGFTEAYTAIKSSLPCRHSPLSLGEASVAAQQFGAVSGKVLLRPGDDVRRGDRLTVTDTRRTVRYEVQGVANPSEAGVYKIAWVSEDPRQGTP